MLEDITADIWKNSRIIKGNPCKKNKEKFKNEKVNSCKSPLKLSPSPFPLLMAPALISTKKLGDFHKREKC